MSNFAKKDFMLSLPLILTSVFNTLFCSNESIDNRFVDLIFKLGVMQGLGMFMWCWFYNLTKV